VKSRMDDDTRDDNAGTAVLQRAGYAAADVDVAEIAKIVMAEQNPRSWESFEEVRKRVHVV
jgi:hypothetical protein